MVLFRVLYNLSKPDIGAVRLWVSLGKSLSSALLDDTAADTYIQSALLCWETASLHSCIATAGDLPAHLTPAAARSQAGGCSPAALAV